MPTNQKKRVAFVAPSMRGGGAERVILDLATGFSTLGYSVDLVLVNAEGPYLQFIPDTVRVINLASNRTYKSLPAFIKYLRAERPLSILSTVSNVNIMVVWARKLSGIPSRVIVRETNISPQRFFPINGLRKTVFRHLKRISYLIADKVVAVSMGVKNDLISFLNIPCETIEVIYNPADNEKILANASEKFEHHWFADNSVPVVIALGRLSKAKGFETLLRAFSLVKKNVDSRLLILGEGDERGRLEVLIKSLGLENYVDMPGFVNNPFPYVARARVLVLSSIHEGLPNVLVQALILGTPVVSTDCDSGPSEILENGEFGRLVKVGDSEAMAREILDTITRKNSEANRRKSFQRGAFFNLEKALEAYQCVLLPNDLTTLSDFSGE